jgi:hypothetical protein
MKTEGKRLTVEREVWIRAKGRSAEGQEGPDIRGKEGLMRERNE